MAENTNYIGVAMGLDVTDLKAGLSEANKEIQLANSKFKAASSGMEDWTKSSEGLTAKIEQLDTVLKMQKSKLSGLQAEYEKVAKEQGENSEAARKLQLQINNQQAAVNRTEREFNNYKATLAGVEDGTIDLEKVTLRGGKAIEKAGKQVEKAGEQAEDAGDGFTVAKGAVAEFVGNGLTALVSKATEAITSMLELSESTREYRTSMALLNTNAERMGVSTETTGAAMKYLSGIVEDTGSAVEGISNLLQTGFTDNNMANAVETLSNAIIAFPDTLKFESLSDSIQESMQQLDMGNNATGQFAELLERLGYNLDTVKEKYSGLSGVEEKQAYLLDLVNKKLGGTAQKYREQNAELVKAKETQYDYNNEMAELGEVLEPVNSEIKELKIELAREFAPTLKKDVIPAVNDFFDGLEDTGAVDKAGKGIAFLVRNLDDILTVTVTAIGVWKTFTTVMAISNTISKTSAALAAYTGAVNTAKKAQIAFNAAQSSNLFGAIATLAATAITAIATYALTAKDGKKATDLLTESQRAAVTKAEELAEAYRETREASAKLAAQELSHIDYAEDLWGELQKLADKNGVVKKGYEDRAKFILTELNKALGTEYTMNGNIIGQYGDMKKSIEDVIVAKRAQILLTAQEENYKKAVENVMATEQARATQAQELVKQEEIVAQKKAALADAKEAYENTADARTKLMYNQQMQRIESELKAEENKLSTLQTKYNENEEVLYQYYSDIATYEKASTLIMQGETAKAVQYLDELAAEFKTVSNTAKLGADEQKKVLEQQVIDTEINARLMKEAYENGVEGVTEEMVTTAKEQADKAKTEFKKVGGNITEGIAEGSEEKEWTLTSAMENVISAGLKAAKAAAGIKSPARLFRKEVGKHIGEGVGVGVLDAIPEVKKDVQKFNDFLADSIGTGNSVADLSANIANSGDAIHRAASGGAGAGVTNNSKSTVINAGMTVNYNGKLSRKQLKKQENDHYTAVKTRLRTEGAI